MSVVTSITAVVRFAPQKDLDWLCQKWLQEADPDRHFEQWLRPLDRTAAGGSKVMEVDVYAAACNHLDVDEAWRLLEEHPWHEIAQFTVVINHEYAQSARVFNKADQTEQSWD
jgi:hypothetical protein